MPPQQRWPRCMKCYNRTPYVLDFIRKGKRWKVCQQCYNQIQEEVGEKQLHLFKPEEK